MKIDSHQHFWIYGSEYAWIDDSIAMLRRDFLPGDLEPLLKENGFDGCIAVQARQTVEETEFLLKLARENDFIKGVVGWVDLNQPFEVEDSKLKGIRHIVQAEPIGFLDQPNFRAGVRALAKKGLTYDLLIRSNQLEEATRFVQAVPEVKIVLDHIAKPDIRNRQWEPWASNIREISRCDNLYVKLSGMAFEADWATWTSDTLAPYMEHVLACFGPKRCMIGSDWPVCLAAGNYGKIIESIESLLSDDDATAMLGGNASAFYNLTA
ncbi:MAG: amidohydrolase family protein [Fimbriimonadaceae bacterium]